MSQPGLGFFTVFFSSCLIFLVPFLGPSTMLYAGSIAAIYSEQSPIMIGLAVAVGASIAKMVHYYISFFARRVVSQERINKLEGYCKRWGRWKSFAVFVSSATPIPDEPVLVSLALVNYSPLKFLLVFFIGKIVITVPGAYVGSSASKVLCESIGQIPITIGSIIITILVTIVLLKVDFGRKKQ